MTLFSIILISTAKGKIWGQDETDDFAFFIFHVKIVQTSLKPSSRLPISPSNFFLHNLLQNDQKYGILAIHKQIYGQNLAVTTNP